MSTAEDIALKLGHDASRFKTPGGRPLDDEATMCGGDFSCADPENALSVPYRWKFPDGSAIVVYSSAPDAPLQWTLGLDDAPDRCFCPWHGKGEHAPSCQESRRFQFQFRLSRSFRALIEKLRGRETASEFVRRLIEDEAKRQAGTDPVRAMLAGYSMTEDGFCAYCRACGEREKHPHDQDCPVRAVLGPIVGASNYRATDGLAEPPSGEASAPAKASRQSA